MDPRHPEDSIWRMRQLMDQFQFVLDKLNNETVSSKLGEAEREGALVVQEICLVAPRLHEAMMQASRRRRHDLTHGVVEEAEKNIKEPTPEALETYVEPNQAETVIVEPKPRKKKKTTKKKKDK